MEQVMLIGCLLPDTSEAAFEYSMEELAALTNTAEGKVVEVMSQKRQKLSPGTYIGRGKLEEAEQLVQLKEIDTVIFNDELTPSQQAEITKHVSAKVIDRTQLILDIFAERAHSREGQLQVELAQMEYMLPRLTGIGESLSRLGGGIGTRGPGETQLETDRRHIRRRIDDIKKQLDNIVRHRDTYRSRRKQNNAFQVALVGYTNAGKSTLFNYMTNETALQEDKLFATLDPLTRRFETPSGFTGLLTDTVGFIQHLPTTLVAAFRSTLEEVKEADLILHVVDYSHPDYQQHENTVNQLLNELGAGEIPHLMVFNKQDLVSKASGLPVFKDAIGMSALNSDDVERLLALIEAKITEQSEPYHIHLEPDNGRLLSNLHDRTIITKKVWDEENAYYTVDGFVPINSPLKPQIMNKDH